MCVEYKRSFRAHSREEIKRLQMLLLLRQIFYYAYLDFPREAKNPTNFCDFLAGRGFDDKYFRRQVWQRKFNSFEFVDQSHADQSWGEKEGGAFGWGRSCIDTGVDTACMQTYLRKFFLQ